MSPEEDKRTKDSILAEEAATIFHNDLARQGYHNESQDRQTAVLDVFERQVVPREHLIEELMEKDKKADLVGKFGVFSRTALEARLMWIAEKYLQIGEGEGTLVLIADVDDLKKLNGTAVDKAHGHEIGDAALCAAAEALVENTRMGDTVARIGGDEFAVICKVGSPELAKGIAEGTVLEGIGVRSRGLIERVRQGLEEKRQRLQTEYGTDWPEDGEKKKPGQLSMGWSYVPADQLGKLYQQYKKNNEVGKNIKGDFVSMVVKEADGNMFKDKRSQG